MVRKLSFLVCVVFLFGIFITHSYAANLDELMQQMEQSQDKLKESKEQRAGAEAERKNVMATIGELDQEIAGVEQEVARLDDEIAGLEKNIKTKEQDIEQKQEEYNEQKELFKVRLKNMYENGDVSYLEVLLGCKSFTEMFSKYEIIKSIMDFDKKLLASIHETKLQIEDSKKLLELEKSTQEASKSQRVAAMENLSRSRSTKQEYLRKINADIDALKRAEQEWEQQSAEVAEMIKQLQESTKKYAGGVMEWPTPGYYEITSPFGYRPHPIYGYRSYHSGVDIAAPGGANIVAANSGTVIFSGWQSGYGNTVIIDHGGGITTLYAHASRLVAQVGDKVEVGEVVSKVGTTGMSTGNHLHFEVRVKGEAVDPSGYLNY